MEAPQEFKPFVRKPFEVDAIEITEENMADLAPLIGELDVRDDGVAFIKVNRKLVPNIYRVFPGYWVTRMSGNNVRCYSPKIFTEQFIEKTEEVAELIDRISPSEDVLVELPTGTWTSSVPVVDVEVVPASEDILISQDIID